MPLLPLSVALPEIVPDHLRDPSTFALIIVTFLCAGLIKGVIGLGLPVVVLAMLSTTVGLKTALSLMIVPGVVMNIWQALDGPYFWSNLERLWSMWLVSVVAIWLGTFALATYDAWAMTAVLGIILSLYAILALSRPRIPPPRTSEPWLSPLIGATAGFLFGATGTYMVPGVLYIEALGLNRDAFVQALGMTFLIITSTLGLGLMTNNIMNAGHGTVSMLALIPAFIGLSAGRWLRSHVAENTFRKVFFCLARVYGLVYFFSRCYVTARISPRLIGRHANVA